MKKIIIMVISVSLLIGAQTGTPFTVQQKLQQVWNCAWEPKKHAYCSSEAIALSRRWIMSAPAKVRAAQLLKAGVRVTKKQIRKKQENGTLAGNEVKNEQGKVQEGQNPENGEG